MDEESAKTLEIKIRDFFKVDPEKQRSIQEIARKFEISWITAKKKLVLLEKLGIIEKTLDRDRLTLFKLKNLKA